MPELLRRKILIADVNAPDPDRDGASLRMTMLLRVLGKMNTDITFAACHVINKREKEDGDVLSEFTYHTFDGIRGLQAYLQGEAAQFDIIILCRVLIAAHCIDLIKRVAPHSYVIFDTVDLHYLRGFRGARVTKNRLMLQQALQAKQHEVAVTEKADCTLVVSDVEKSMLQEECPSSTIRVISIPQDISEEVPPRQGRHGILFIGSFWHHPNLDAMLYFSNSIYPLLRKQHADIPFHIVGDHAPAEIRALNDQPGIEVLGYVRDIVPLLDKCVCSVAPLRYGAGVKGKVILSMAHGLPVVATTIAAEGIPAKTNFEIMIADSAADTVEALVALYTNNDLWQRVSRGGQNVISRHFSAGGAAAEFERIFADMACRSIS